MPMTPRGGYPVVLTADRTLIAGYTLLFDGMLAASQTTTTPWPMMAGLLMPHAPCDAGRARLAPLGLRRIEAALLDGGFTPDEVVIACPDHLDAVIGPATRVVALSSGEPAGHGMNTSTMTGVAGGRIYPQVLFEHLLRSVRHRVQRSGAAARVVLGGPGAWQLTRQPALLDTLGIDHLVTGYAEGNAARLVRGLCDGEALPRIMAGEGVPPEAIPRLRGATTMGVVEISRGCGLGCEFCTIGQVPMGHLPPEAILADVRTTLAHGLPNVAIAGEDCFRYGARGMRANPGAFIDLLHRLRALPGLRLLQCDHANISSVAQYSDAELAAVRAALVGATGQEFPWVNVGVETAAGALLKANGGAAKMGGHHPEEWGALCAEQVRRLCRAGFFPLVSLLLALPNEQPADTAQTLAWVEELRAERLAIFPMVYEPLDETALVPMQRLRPPHWRLMRRSYDFNFHWVPRMYWDNQTAAGIPLARRVLLQGLGNGQALLWKTLFAWHAAHARDD